MLDQRLAALAADDADDAVGRADADDAYDAVGRADAADAEDGVQAIDAFQAGAVSPWWALLPANTRALTPVTDEDRVRFQHTIAARMDRYGTDSAPADARRTEGSFAEPQNLVQDALTNAACSTCGGACCTRGGSHAFLSADNLRRNAALLGVAPNGIALGARYLEHAPQEHYEGSCLFHGVRGCTLPRRLRSDTCNDYHCGDLTQLERRVKEDDALEIGGTQRVLLGAASWHAIERTQRIAISRNGVSMAAPAADGNRHVDDPPHPAERH